MTAENTHLVISAEPIPLEADIDGVMRVSGTRVTLDTIVAAFKEGAVAEEIVYQYPLLKLADVYAVLAYYLQHRLQVEAYLDRRQESANEVQKENEAQFDPRGIRERLLSRRARLEVAGNAASGC